MPLAILFIHPADIVALFPDNQRLTLPQDLARVLLLWLGIESLCWEELSLIGSFS